MKASKLIEALERIIKDKGDQEIIINTEHNGLYKYMHAVTFVEQVDYSPKPGKHCLLIELR